MIRHRQSSLVVLLVWTLGAVPLPAQPPASPEEFARRQFESGLEFLRTGRAIEALKDFRTVVDNYPGTTVADDALLAIARYELEVRRDAAAARAAADGLLKKFPASDSIAMAYVVLGRAMVAQGMTAANVDAALASFERVPRLFAGTEAVAPALVAAGDTLRRLDRCPEALNRFMRVELEYPRTRWAALARVSAASCETAAGRPIEALALLQRAVDLDPAAPEASSARALSTVLYRLYLRAPSQLAWTPTDRVITGPAGRLREVHGIAVGPDGSLFVGTRTGVQVLDATGRVARTLASASEARAMFVDARGSVAIAQRAVLQPEGSAGAEPSLVTLTVPREGAQTRVVDDITAMAALSSGERLVADRGQRAVYRFDAGGKYLGSFATGRVTRIAVGPADEVAMLDRDQKQVMVVDRAGRPLARIAAKGTGWAMDNPADVAFDPLGHVYVLDRTNLLVFARDGRLVLSFAPASGSPGAFRAGAALAVDAAGRLYLYDERAERVQVYQ